jgi:hypothetical protein
VTLPRLTQPPGTTLGVNFATKLAGGVPPPSLQDQAAAIAASMIDPQTAAVNRAIQAKQQLMGGQGAGYAGVIDALGRLTSGIPEAVRSAYQTAGDQTAGYASSLTGTLGDAAKSAAAEAAQHIASLGAPGTVTSVAPDALNVANYSYGTLPSSSLAAEAASRLTEQEGLRAAGGYALGQQALQAMNATRSEISDLQAKGLDIENTRPGEVQKALSSLRDENRANQQLAIAEKNYKLQARAEGVQESQLNRAWLQTLNSEAFNRTNATGTLWVVKGNKIVNTGQSAPGSAAGRAQTTAATAAANRRAKATHDKAVLAEKQAHDTAMEGIQNSRITISQQEADAASQRARAYARYQDWKRTHPNATGAGPGGLKQSDIRQYGKDAGNATYLLFYGKKNPKYVPDSGRKDAAGNPIPGQFDKNGVLIPGTNVRYIQPPGSAADAMKYMLNRKIPYQIAWQAIYRYAKDPGSPWHDALQWNPAYKPPSQRNKGAESPGGPRKGK